MTRINDGITTEKAPRFRRGAYWVLMAALLVVSMWAGSYLFWGDPAVGAALGAIAWFGLLEFMRRRATR